MSDKTWKSALLDLLAAPSVVCLLAVVCPLVAAGCSPSPQRAAEAGREPDQHRQGEESHAEGDHSDGTVQLPPDQLAELGIELGEAGPAHLALTLELPGTVHIDGDRTAHVAPRVAGVVRRVDKSLGEAVRRGEPMAELDSRELADAKAAFLAAGERRELAEATHRREKRLWEQKISPEGDYLDARRELAEADIALRTAEQKLHALGLSQQQVEALSDQPDTAYTHYTVHAPFTGTVIEKHLTLGETVAAGTPVFVVSDLSTVWIDLQVYQKDLGRLAAGQPVRLTTGREEDGGHRHDEMAMITFVQPLVGAETRTALARIVVENADRRWHPGEFVAGEVEVERAAVPVAIPRTAVIGTEDGADVVFVPLGSDRYMARPVELGRHDRDLVEVLSGLSAGDRLVVAGAFSLKAELNKGSFTGGHAH